MKAYMECTVEKSRCGHTTGCGCRLWHGCCTKCPRETCTYDTPDPRQVVYVSPNQARDLEILMLRDNGAPIRDIADQFRLSLRTVHRALSGGVT